MSVRTRDWLKFIALVGFAFVLGLAFASALDLRGNSNAAQAALLQQPGTRPLIPAAKWKVTGQSAPKVDGRAFVTGKHRYPSDQKLPDMLYGKVLRPPSFGATLLSVDSQQAEKMGATPVAANVSGNRLWTPAGAAAGEIPLIPATAPGLLGSTALANEFVRMASGT